MSNRTLNAAALAGMIFVGSSAFGQMSFSFYDSGSVSSDYSTVYEYTNMIDNSNCGHTNYLTTVVINSPDGRSVSVDSSSLGGSASISIDNVMGTYTTSANVSYYCACSTETLNTGGGGTPIGVNGFTPIDHNYPANPLPNACRITSFFDAVRNSRAHHAQDLVYDNGQGGGTPPPYGTPVYAMEGGRVLQAVWTAGPSGTPYPGCAGMGVQGNYLKVESTPAGSSTIYFHMNPTPTFRSRNAPVNAGDLIGYTDNSGCQSGPHLHVGRKNSQGIPVNFTIPCVNPTPTSRYDDGTVGDDVPEVLGDDLP